MLQRAMSKEYGWDSTLDEILRKHFQRWADSIPRLAELSIPRYWNGPFDEDDIVSKQFHAFIVILVSHSHVVPLNAKKVFHHNSIVRLELVAALKAAQLKQFLESALGRKLPIVFFWFDRKPVVKQIYGTDLPNKSFSMKRLTKIHSASEANDWFYIPGKMNPADYCSRGIQAHETEKSKTFHHGPQFLYQDRSTWPTTNIPWHPVRRKPEDIIAVDATSAMALLSTSMFADAALKVGFRGWRGKVHCVAWLLRFFNKWRLYVRHPPTEEITCANKPTPFVHPPISDDEFQVAKTTLLISIQLSHFLKEFWELEEQHEAQDVNSEILQSLPPLPYSLL